jgi:D-glycero-beta-D-manno-heptose-7-phosphate kinase
MRIFPKAPPTAKKPDSNQHAQTETTAHAECAPVPRARIAAVRVLVIGDVMLDCYWFGDANRISPEAPVPVIHIQHSEERLGGAANVACNAHALGAHTALVCIVGEDDPGRRVTILLKEQGIHAHIDQDATWATTIKLRIISRQQQLLRVDFEHPPAHEVLLASLARVEALLPEQDVVLISDYGKGGLVHVTKMITAARAAGKPILVDPKNDDWTPYRGATLITPNRAELRAVIGAWQSEDDLSARVTQLRAALELDALLLTRSEEGMTVFDNHGILHVPAAAREVYDVSGAGDTVVATIATLLGAGTPLSDAVRHANRAAGIVVGKLGAATVDYHELFP